jgi:hypothetical protein
MACADPFAIELPVGVVGGFCVTRTSPGATLQVASRFSFVWLLPERRSAAPARFRT